MLGRPRLRTEIYREQPAACGAGAHVSSRGMTGTPESRETYRRNDADRAAFAADEVT